MAHRYPTSNKCVATAALIVFILARKNLNGTVEKKHVIVFRHFQHTKMFVIKILFKFRRKFQPSIFLHSDHSLGKTFPL